MSKPSKLDRRQFSERLVIGAGSLVVTAIANGNDTKQQLTNLRATDEGAKDDRDGQGNPLADSPPPEVLLLTYLVRTYPSDNYYPEAIRGIFRDLHSDVLRSHQLSEFPLKNSDGPYSR